MPKRGWEACPIVRSPAPSVTALVTTGAPSCRSWKCRACPTTTCRPSSRICARRPRAPRGASVETGRYLVESVSLCWSCHTERSQMTGAFTGPRFGGTTGFTEAADPANSWSPPNITSDPETGRLGKLTEDQFVVRFRQGRVIPGSPMPWQEFSRMNEGDLRSIYQYLKTVPPVARDNGPPVVSGGK